MMAKFLEQENLREGLNDYLNTYKYGNAEIKDLWYVFTRNTNQSIDVKVVTKKCVSIITIRCILDSNGYLDATNGISLDYNHKRWS